MINPKYFLEVLSANGVFKFSGVPDSLLSELSIEFEHSGKFDHLIVPHEAMAVADAIGTYLATGNLCGVYMQNSGLPNAMNALTSLAHSKVFGIPMILIIGWRGEKLKTGKQIADEPQHLIQGAITLKQLEMLDIPFLILDSESVGWENNVKEIIELSVTLKKPVALVVRKSTFESTHLKERDRNSKGITRDEAVDEIVGLLGDNAVYVASTGYLARSLYGSLKNKKILSQGFYCVGGMGLASSIAAAISRNSSDLIVVCLDGDGSFQMYLSSLVNMNKSGKLLHFLFSNGVHESVGGQRISNDDIDYKQLISSFHLNYGGRASSKQSLRNKMQKIIDSNCYGFIEISIKNSSNSNLLRPSEKMNDLKLEFMSTLRRISY